MAFTDDEKDGLEVIRAALEESRKDKPSFLTKGAVKSEDLQPEGTFRKSDGTLTKNTGPDLQGQIKNDISSISIDNNPVSNFLRKAIPDARPGEFGAPRYDDAIAHDPIAQQVISMPLTMGAGALARPLGALAQGGIEGLTGAVTTGANTPGQIGLGVGLGALGRLPQGAAGAVERSAARPPGAVAEAFKDVYRGPLSPKGAAWRGAAEFGAHQVGLPPGTVTGAVAGAQTLKAGTMAMDEALAAAARKLGIKPAGQPRPPSVPPPVSSEIAPGLPHPTPIDDAVPMSIAPEKTVQIPRQTAAELDPLAGKVGGIDLAAEQAKKAAIPDDTALLNKTQRIELPGSKSEAYKARLASEEEARFAKRMGKSVPEYRALLAEREKNLGAAAVSPKAPVVPSKNSIEADQVEKRISMLNDHARKIENKIGRRKAMGDFVNEDLKSKADKDAAIHEVALAELKGESKRLADKAAQLRSSDDVVSDELSKKLRASIEANDRESLNQTVSSHIFDD